jgi:iron-sulfur cluster assembly protein
VNELNLTITPAADRFVRSMLQFDGGPDSGLQLVVSPSGHSGLSARFAVADWPEAGESVFETNGLRFFLPAQSVELLRGVTMDFQETPTSAGFEFQVPDKISTCGTLIHGA